MASVKGFVRKRGVDDIRPFLLSPLLIIHFDLALGSETMELIIRLPFPPFSSPFSPSHRKADEDRDNFRPDPRRSTTQPLSTCCTRTCRHSRRGEWAQRRKIGPEVSRRAAWIRHTLCLCWISTYTRTLHLFYSPFVIVPGHPSILQLESKCRRKGRQHSR